MHGSGGSGKKGVERIVAVAFPYGQGRVADAHNQLTHNLAHLTAKNGYRHLWLRADTRSESAAGVWQEKYHRRTVSWEGCHNAQQA